MNLPPLLDIAPDGKELKAGVIGCGGRGTGAAINFLNAGPNLRITALGDVFQDRIDGCREKLKTQKGVEVPGENCFTGFDAFEKVIDSGVYVMNNNGLVKNAGLPIPGKEDLKKCSGRGLSYLDGPYG